MIEETMRPHLGQHLEALLHRSDATVNNPDTQSG